MLKIRQRVVSRTEPELGLGTVAGYVGESHIEVVFATCQERRCYALGNAPLIRLKLRAGQQARLASGHMIVVTEAEECEETGLIRYHHDEGTIWEDDLEDVVHENSVLDDLMRLRLSSHKAYELRRSALEISAHREVDGLQGLVGTRVQPLAHQLYIAHELSRRVLPRVLLADEVGLGKTIEAGLIFAALRAMDRAAKVLIVTPEALVHQWLAEMYRRFYQLFTVVDEERCQEEIASQGASAFQLNSHVLTSMSFLQDNPERLEEVLDNRWDLVIIDEAHHMRWNPEQPSCQWQVGQKLSQVSRGLLLLTATPQRFGAETLFGLLNLVDEARFSDYDAFIAQQDQHHHVAQVCQLIETEGLLPEMRTQLKALFQEDDGLQAQLDDLECTADEVLASLVDRHGTGRVLFRNRRARLKGFPKRCLADVALEGASLGLEQVQGDDALAVLELATGSWQDGVSSSSGQQAKLDWLKGFLESHERKVLVLCRNKAGVSAIAGYLADHKPAIFHDGLSVVERDQQAARFAEPDGPQILICSEIGGEGRNFQFASDIVFMDLPKHPDLVEQRVGRLDRIGQRRDVKIHVPWVKGGPEQPLFAWLHHGLDAFEKAANGHSEALECFADELFEVIEMHLDPTSEPQQSQEQLKALIERTQVFCTEERERQRQSVDTLIDLNSFNTEQGQALLNSVEDKDDDTSVEFFMRDFFDHYGVDYEDYDDCGSLLVKPAGLSFIEHLPGVSGLEETVMAFDREVALRREEVIYLTQDHGIVDECMSFLLQRHEGVASLCKWPDSPIGRGVLLECTMVLESMGPKHLELSRFLPRLVYELGYNHKGHRVKEKRHKREPELLVALAPQEVPSDLERLRELLEQNIIRVLEKSRRWADDKVAQALSKAEDVLAEELRRSEQLLKVNPLMRPEELEELKQRAEESMRLLAQAQPRLDSVRLIFTS